MVAAKEGPIPAGTLSRETAAPDGDTKARTCFREIFSPENRAVRRRQGKYALLWSGLAC